jgi:hypothetical protein
MFPLQPQSRHPLLLTLVGDTAVAVAVVDMVVDLLVQITVVRITTTIVATVMGTRIERDLHTAMAKAE